MNSIFDSYQLQREELLARIAQELQLDQTRMARMESAYHSVADLLKNDPEFFEGLEIEVYAQGSTRTMTTVRPIKDGDFDLDVVVHIYDPHFNHSPLQIYNALVSALEKNSYYNSIMEKKTRCVRLNYKGEFHMDILPACMPDFIEKEAIKIPEKSLSSWSDGNPKGHATWFLRVAYTVDQETMLLKHRNLLLTKAEVEAEELPKDHFYLKTPLQRSVQLLKRYRDLYFQNRDYRVSSIVITTLAAQFYQGENSIFETIDNIVSRIKDDYTRTMRQGHRFKIFNPVNLDEDFTDSWTSEHYDNFYSFINDFYSKWQKLKNSFEESKEEYIELFGEGVYKKSLQDQLKRFSKSTNDGLAQASGLILSGAAQTNPKGNINSTTGVKNKPHHNYGGNY